MSLITIPDDRDENGQSSTDRGFTGRHPHNKAWHVSCRASIALVKQFIPSLPIYIPGSLVAWFGFDTIVPASRRSLVLRAPWHSILVLLRTSHFAPNWAVSKSIKPLIRCTKVDQVWDVRSFEHVAYDFITSSQLNGLLTA